MNWEELVTYSDGNLFWKVKPHRKANAGDKVGTPHSMGYIQVCLNNTLTLVHTIVWELHNGPVPDGKEIDHINRVRTDNRIENLRLVSRKDNQRNKGKYCNNVSGVTGVYFDKSVNKWLAFITLKGKTINLGKFLNKDDAIKARKDAEKLYGFSVGHGM